MTMLAESIFIHPSALCDAHQSPRSFLIRGLGRISDAGTEILLDDGSPEFIRAALAREHIPFKLQAGLESGWVVKGDDHALSLHHPDKKTKTTFSDWHELSQKLLFPDRKSIVNRNTSETRIQVEINLDGNGTHDISTGLGFFDHMLEQIARHGHIDLKLRCEGDLHIDEHHTIEDTALALGEAIYQALGDKRGVTRYASVLPMDESRAMVALDLSGRPYLVFEADFSRDKVGDVPTEMIKHFWYSLAMNTKCTLHIEAKGENDHHIIEAIFKGFAVVLRQAVQRTGRNEIPSSKGVL